MSCKTESTANRENAYEHRSNEVNSLFAVYVVIFDDGRIKIGISKNPRQRITYYAQEVRRNFGKYFTWFACKPFACKDHALSVETSICRWLSDFSITGHREWFSGVTHKEFVAIIEQIERFRFELAIENDEEKKDIPWNGLFGNFKNTETV